jgi:hypothetical protein
MAAAPDSVRPSDAEIARAAVIHALASNLAMLAVVVAVNVAIAKRDSITRAGRRAVALVRPDAEEGRFAAELADLARDVCEISHADLGGAP